MSFHYEIKKVGTSFLEQVKQLDKICKEKYSEVLSGEVANKLQSNEKGTFIFGIFHKDKMIGYCTLDEYCNNGKIESVLSNVFVLPDYQRKNIGTKMVSYVIKKAKRPMYICCLGEQFHFYERFGFKQANDCPDEIMILK